MAVLEICKVYDYWQSSIKYKGFDDQNKIRDWECLLHSLLKSGRLTELQCNKFKILGVVGDNLRLKLEGSFNELVYLIEDMDIKLNLSTVGEGCHKYELTIHRADRICSVSIDVDTKSNLHSNFNLYTYLFDLFKRGTKLIHLGLGELYFQRVVLMTGDKCSPYPIALNKYRSLNKLFTKVELDSLFTMLGE